MSVRVDDSVRVPMAYVQEGEIVLNTSYDATSHLQIDNESVHFQARFGGVMHDILIPIGRIQAVFARENGQGMGFAVVEDASEASIEELADEAFDGQADAEADAAFASDASAGDGASADVSTASPAGQAQTEPAEMAPQRAPLSAVPSAEAGAPSDEPPPAPNGAGKKRPALRLVK